MCRIGALALLDITAMSRLPFEGEGRDEFGIDPIQVGEFVEYLGVELRPQEDPTTGELAVGQDAYEHILQR